MGRAMDSEMITGSETAHRSEVQVLRRRLDMEFPAQSPSLSGPGDSLGALAILTPEVQSGITGTQFLFPLLRG